MSSSRAGVPTRGVPLLSRYRSHLNSSPLFTENRSMIVYLVLLNALKLYAEPSSALSLTSMMAGHMPSVIKGRRATAEDIKTFPWIGKASMSYGKGYGQATCSGFFVKKNCYVFAKHCLGDQTVGDKTKSVESIKICPGLVKTNCYSADPKRSYKFKNEIDIAVVKLKGEPSLPNYQLDVLMTTDKEFKDFFVPGETECTVMGYGVDKSERLDEKTYKDSHSGELNIGEMNLVGTVSSLHGFFGDKIVEDGEVLKGHASPSMIAGGDSGGPMACKINGVWKIVGVNKSLKNNRGFVEDKEDSVATTKVKEQPHPHALYKAGHFTVLHKFKPELEEAMETLGCGKEDPETEEDREREFETLNEAAGGYLGSQIHTWSFGTFEDWANNNPKDLDRLKTLIKTFSNLPLDKKIFIGPSPPDSRNGAKAAQYYHYTVSDSSNSRLGTFAMYKDKDGKVHKVWEPAK